MSNILASLAPALDSAMSQLGIHGISGLDASVYIVGATVFLGFCAAVHSATRIANLRCSARLR